MPRPAQMGIWSEVSNDTKYSNSVDVYVNGVKVMSLNPEAAVGLADGIKSDAATAKKRNDARAEAARYDRY